MSPKGPSAGSLIGLPLAPPHRYTPERLLSGGQKNEACLFGKLFYVERITLYKIKYPPQISNHRVAKNRKLATLKHAIFLTQPLIRNLYLINKIISLEVLGFARHVWLCQTLLN